jgi:heat-inducible transcriptional repressor
MFVDSLLEVGTVAPGGSREDRRHASVSNDQDVTPCWMRFGAALSVITRGASLVLAPKHEAAIRHIEFVSLGPDRALVVLVFADGHVENRVFTPPPGQTPSSMREAANFLNALAEGRTLSELRARMVAGNRKAPAGNRFAGRASWSKAALPFGKTGRAVRASDRARSGQPDRRAPEVDQSDVDRIRACSTTWSASATSPNS